MGKSKPKGAAPPPSVPTLAASGSAHVPCPQLLLGLPPEVYMRLGRFTTQLELGPLFGTSRSLSQAVVQHMLKPGGQLMLLRAGKAASKPLAWRAPLVQLLCRLAPSGLGLQLQGACCGIAIPPELHPLLTSLRAFDPDLRLTRSDLEGLQHCTRLKHLVLSCSFAAVNHSSARGKNSSSGGSSAGAGIQALPQLRHACVDPAHISLTYVPGDMEVPGWALTVLQALLGQVRQLRAGLAAGQAAALLSSCSQVTHLDLNWICDEEDGSWLVLQVLAHPALQRAKLPAVQLGPEAATAARALPLPAAGAPQLRLEVWQLDGGVLRALPLARLQRLVVTDAWFCDGMAEADAEALREHGGKVEVAPSTDISNVSIRGLRAEDVQPHGKFEVVGGSVALERYGGLVLAAMTRGGGGPSTLILPGQMAQLRACGVPLGAVRRLLPRLAHTRVKAVCARLTDGAPSEDEREGVWRGLLRLVPPNVTHLNLFVWDAAGALPLLLHEPPSHPLRLTLGGGGNRVPSGAQWERLWAECMARCPNVHVVIP